MYIFDHTVGAANERLLLEVYIFDQGSKRYVYNFDQGLRISGVHFWSKVLESIFRSFVKSKVYIFDQGLRILSVHFWSYCRNGVCRADEQSVHFWSKVSFYECTFLITDLASSFIQFSDQIILNRIWCIESVHFWSYCRTV